MNDSVISIVILSGSTSCVFRTLMNRLTKSLSWICLTDTLSATLKFRYPPSSALLMNFATERSMKSPISSIRPVSSAIGMKRPGGTFPRRGLFHRARASKPSILPVLALICGW